MLGVAPAAAHLDREPARSSGWCRASSSSLIAMGIVLVYRSSRVINFAVGDLGVPAAAVLAVMVGKIALAVLARRSSSRCSSARSSGTVVEIAVIRRLVEGAARDRARRDDRRRRAVPGGRAHAPRLPHRQAPDRRTRAR